MEDESRKWPRGRNIPSYGYLRSRPEEEVNGGKQETNMTGRNRIYRLERSLVYKENYQRLEEVEGDHEREEDRDEHRDRKMV